MGIITSADLKAYLGIEDGRDDAQIDAVVASTNQGIIEHCGRTFDKTAVASPTTRVFRPTRQGVLEVDDFWETTALVVKTDDGDDGVYETTWTINTDFILEPLNGLRHGQAWPYDTIVSINRLFPTWNRRPGVQITAAWGWAAIPASVTTAALLIGARLQKRRNSPEGVLNGFTEFGPVRISRNEDPDAFRLLGPFVHPSKAALVG